MDFKERNVKGEWGKWGKEVGKGNEGEMEEGGGLR